MPQMSWSPDTNLNSKDQSQLDWFFRLLLSDRVFRYLILEKKSFIGPTLNVKGYPIKKQKLVKINNNVNHWGIKHNLYM